MSDFSEIILRVVILFATIIALTRIHVLRSFSKMSGSDFAIPVAVGSVLAGAITTLSALLWHFLIALAVLFAFQIAMAQIHARNDSAEPAMDNSPVLVIEDGKPIPEILTHRGRTLSDLHTKLREANAFDLS